MSRIGKKPIPVPSGVTVTISGQTVNVKGPKSELSLTTVDDVKVAMGEEGVQVTPANDGKRARSMWGLQRTLIANMIEGVTKGFEQSLELHGVGYRAQLQGTNLKLQLGYSHEVIYTPPAGITILAPRPTEIRISGADKQKVGQVAAEIREYRPPEPYLGKGVRYAGEHIRRKEGKKK
jgi:large subunit ribosomal protein L6